MMSRKVNLADMAASHARVEEPILKRTEAFFASGMYMYGADLLSCEKNLARFVGAKHCICVSSGTDALIAIMMAAGIAQGDEVLTTPFTFYATVSAMLVLGVKPVFVDIDPQSYLLDESQIESKITARTKAIAPVSLFGQCPDFSKINEIAKKHQLLVIEDSAQSFGATQSGEHSCHLSGVSATSFYPVKPLGCYGDGGACFTDDDSLAEKIRMTREHGSKTKYLHEAQGLNFRMNTLQAIVVEERLKIFPSELEKRQWAAAEYSRLLEERNLASLLLPPKCLDGNTHAYAQYTIRLPKERDAVVEDLKARGVGVAVHYPSVVYKQPAFLEKIPEAQDYSFPEAERAAAEVLSLPLHPYLSLEDIHYVVDQLQEVLKAREILK